MPVMVIESSTHRYYFNPCDTTKLIAAHGDFSIQADVAKVNSILEAMAKAKATYYREQGDVTLSRHMTIYVRRFAPRSTAAGGEAAMGAAAKGEAAVAELKARFDWRDEETEALWMKETGWNLLKLACAMDDHGAVTHLLTLPDAKDAMVVKNKGMVMDSTLRRQPFSMLIGGSLEKFDAVTCASTFGSPPVMQAIINAGSALPFSAACGIMGCWNEGGCRSGNVENIAMLLDAKPTLAAAKDEKHSLSITYALQAPQHAQPELIRLFLERHRQLHGSGREAERQLRTALNKRDMFGFRPIDYLAQNADATPEAIALMTSAGAGVEHNYRLSGLMRGLFWVLMHTKMLGRESAEGARRQPWRTLQGMTPVHILAIKGNFKLVESAFGIPEVDAARIKAKMKDKDGATPVDKLSKTHGDTAVSRLLARALGSSEGGGGGGDVTGGTLRPTKQTPKKHAMPLLPPPRVV